MNSKMFSDEMVFEMPLFQNRTNDDDFFKVKKPIIIYLNAIDEQAMEDFRYDCSNIDEKQKIIPIFVNSFGGDAYSLMGIIDVIDELKANGKIIMTICHSKAMSAGSLILAAGTPGYRYASKLSTIMIHDLSTNMDGKYEELRSNMKEIDRINVIFFDLLDSMCDKENGYFKRLIKENSSADFYLSVNDALKHNIIDHVGYPDLNVKIDVNFKCDNVEGIDGK